MQITRLGVKIVANMPIVQGERTYLLGMICSLVFLSGLYFFSRLTAMLFSTDLNGAS